MPPAGYLSVTGIEAALAHLAQRYPSLCTRIALPEATHEGRTCSAVRLGAGTSARRNGVLLVGGLHAREIVNPDLLVTLAFDLCTAYAAGAGLAFGGKAYSAADVKVVLESLYLYVFPQVNPDGRAHVLAPTGDAFWRKNRRPTSGGCVGVDLNRNFDFLWGSGIGSSANPCDYQVYRGTAAFSEAETRNVRHLLDSYPVHVMVDVHSFSELILYPWGDDENQTRTPSMNFANPAYDGVRGVVGDARYLEYLPEPDLSWFARTAQQVRAAIAAVRGRDYTAEPSAGLYPTSGTSTDYAFSRHFGNGATKVRAFCIETGTTFQPPYAEARAIIEEVSAGLVELCRASVCIVERVAAGSAVEARLEALRHFRDRVLVRSAKGAEYARLLEAHNVELLRLAAGSQALRDEAAAVLSAVAAVVLTHDQPAPKRFDAAVIARARKIVKAISRQASPPLREALALVHRDLGRFVGKTVLEGLKPVRPGRPVLAGAKRRKRRKVPATS